MEALLRYELTMATNDQDYRTGMMVGPGATWQSQMMPMPPLLAEIAELRWQLRTIREHYGAESIDALLSQKRSSPLNNLEQP